MLSHGSLFTGIGGFDLGFSRAGIECAWQVEKDPYCQRVLRTHWPNVERYSDVKNITGRELDSVDIITGGFPCQDLSIAGKRRGLAGNRSGLWFEFHRIITEVRPRWVVVENVCGLLNSNNGRDFAILLGGLTGIIPEVPKRGWGNAGAAKGPIYKVVYRVVDSQFFGVPQRRRRVLIVGCLRDSSATKVLFEQTGGEWNTPTCQGRGKGTTTYACRRAQTGSNGWGVQRQLTHTLDATGGDAVTVCNETVSTLQSRDRKGVGNQFVGEGKLVVSYRQLRSDAYQKDNIASTVSHRDYKGETDLVVRGVSMRSRKGSVNLEVGEEQLSCSMTRSSGQKDYVLWSPRSQDGTHRIHDICPTLDSSQGGQRHPCVGIRRLTPLEYERLQGFPDMWTAVMEKRTKSLGREDIDYLRYHYHRIYGEELSDHQVKRLLSDTQRYKQLGNAVTVNVAEWLGNQIVTVEQGPPSSRG